MKLTDYGIRIIRTAHSTQYIKHGMFHRDDGPAFFTSDESYNAYYQLGKYHRTNGPARIWRHGAPEYYLAGRRIEYAQFLLLQRGLL